MARNKKKDTKSLRGIFHGSSRILPSFTEFSYL